MHQWCTRLNHNATHSRLTCGVPTEQQVQPSPRGGDLLQVPRPKQPFCPFGEAHLNGDIAFPSVPAEYRADLAPPLDDPVALTNPDPYAEAYLFWPHATCTRTSSCATEDPEGW
jgi:hypothetical protein